MADHDDPKHEPDSFADLANQPTGSGVADEQAAFEHAQADGTTVADSVGDDDPVPTEAGPEIDESEGQPS